MREMGTTQVPNGIKKKNLWSQRPRYTYLHILSVHMNKQVKEKSVLLQTKGYGTLSKKERRIDKLPEKMQ